MKTCRTCKQEKALTEFYKDSRLKSGASTNCRTCIRAYTKSWSSKNREKLKTQHRRQHLQATYGISLEHYDSLVSKQQGRCLICEREQKLYVDHCHTTGKIRGLLCNNCNTGLGQFQESEEVLLKAISYLKILG